MTFLPWFTRIFAKILVSSIYVPFMFSLLFYHRECSDTNSNHRNKFSLNQNHGIYPFWRPAHATMNIQNLCFLRSYNKNKNRRACPSGKSWRSNTFTRGVKKTARMFKNQNPKAFWLEAPKPSKVLVFWLDIQIN